MEDIKKDSIRVVETKNKIKQALIKILANKKLDKVTIRELCLLADINRTTFYNHYGSQYEVFQEMVWDFLQKTSFEVMKTLQENGNFKTGLVNALHYVESHQDFVKLILKHENYNLMGNVTELMPNFDAMIMNRLPEDLTLPQKKAIITFMQYGSVRVIMEWVQEDFPISAEQECELLLQLFRKLF